MEKFLLGGGNEELPALVGAAALAGYDVIELMWTKNDEPRNGSVGKIHCFEVPRLQGKRKVKWSGADTVSSKLVSGTTYFYPDDNGYNWGYVINSEKNMKKLAHSLGTGWYKIMDMSVRAKVEKLAEEMELPLSPLEKPKFAVKLSVNEIKANAKAKKALTKAEEMQKTIDDLQQTILDMAEKGEAKLKKPLSGVKIPDKNKVKDPTKLDFEKTEE